MLKAIRHDWNEFFFSQRSAVPLGLFRIAFGLILLAWCLLLAPDLRDWYSENGVLPLTGMHAYGMDELGFDLLKRVTDFPVTVTLFAALMLSSLMVTVGYKTRAATVVTYLLLGSFQHRDMIILNGGDTLQRNMAFLLMFADSGAACSVDRLVRIGRGQARVGRTPMVEAWPQRLLQLQLSAVYLSTVASKVGGPSWRDGTALFYALHLTDLRRFSLFGLENQVWFFAPLTYATLVGEFCLGTLIWVPRARKYVLAMGVLLHGGIEYAMDVPLFSYTMIAAYLNFVPQRWVTAAAAWLPRRLGDPYLTLPSDMALPRRGWELAHALDALRLLRIAPPGTGGGEGSAPPAPGGVTARFVMRAFWRLPATWALVVGPAALVIVILPVRWLLAPFCLAWPLLTVGLLHWLAARIALYSTAAPGSGWDAGIGGAASGPDAVGAERDGVGAEQAVGASR